MKTAEQILVVILSATLAVFLVIGIIALLKLNQILEHVKNITAKAEKLADQAEHIGDFFKNTTASAAIGKLVANVITSLKHSKNRGKDE